MSNTCSLIILDLQIIKRLRLLESENVPMLAVRILSNLCVILHIQRREIDL